SAELKRRHVYKVGVAYVVVAWLLVQAASILFPTFGAPAWTMKVFVIVIALGFPLAIILAWAFELTPEGIKRAEAVSAADTPARPQGKKVTTMVVAGALIAGGLLVYQLTRKSNPAAPSSAGTDSKSVAVLPFENL